MPRVKEIKIFGIFCVLVEEDQTLEEAMDQETRMINQKRKREWIQENKDDNQIIRNNDQDCNNHHDFDDNFIFELLPVNDNYSSSTPPKLLTLTQSLMLPWRLKKKIDDMGGHDIKMMIQKLLHKSDLESNKNRFSIPENQISGKIDDFLNPKELHLLEDDITKSKGIQVLVLDPNLQEFNLILKRWQMTKAITYNLTHGWRYVVQSNHFRVGDKVQLWSFRRLDEELGFALVKLAGQ